MMTPDPCRCPASRVHVAAPSATPTGIIHRVYAYVIRSAQAATNDFAEAVRVRRSPFVERVTRSTAEVRDPAGASNFRTELQVC